MNWSIKMPKYDYACSKCQALLEKKLKRDLNDLEYQELVLFETSHSINPSEKELLEAITCPRCSSTECKKSLMNVQITSYIRGNGFLDVAGAKRDMNKYHLLQDDPYKEYRQPGEVDELKTKLERAGKKTAKQQVFDVSAKKSKTSNKSPDSK